MIERTLAFSILAEAITDEIVVTGVGSQTASWLEARPRSLNLYLRGPMGLAPAVGLGVALAHPDRKVVVIEGDGGLLMGLTSLVSIAHCRPPNLRLVCMDNGIYEAGGMGATVNAGRTDFVKIVQGLGIGRAISAGDSETLRETVKELLAVRCLRLPACAHRPQHREAAAGDVPARGDQVSIPGGLEGKISLTGKTAFIILSLRNSKSYQVSFPHFTQRRTDQPDHPYRFRSPILIDPDMIRPRAVLKP